MIKKLKNLIIYFSILFLFFGCISFHNGFIAPNSVNINSPNFKVVKNISGEATASYFLGIGGFEKDGLIKEAKRNMMKSYILDNNEMITNITIDEKTTFFIGNFFVEHTVYISADVVLFSEENLNSPNKQNNSKKTENVKLTIEKDSSKKTEKIKLTIEEDNLIYSNGQNLVKNSQVFIELQNKKYRGIYIEDVEQAVRLKNIQQYYNGKWTEIYKGKTYMFPKNSVLGIIK